MYIRVTWFFQASGQRQEQLCMLYRLLLPNFQMTQCGLKFCKWYCFMQMLKTIDCVQLYIVVSGCLRSMLKTSKFPGGECPQTLVQFCWICTQLTTYKHQCAAVSTLCHLLQSLNPSIAISLLNPPPPPPWQLSSCSNYSQDWSKDSIQQHLAQRWFQK